MIPETTSDLSSILARVRAREILNFVVTFVTSFTSPLFIGVSTVTKV